VSFANYPAIGSLALTPTSLGALPNSAPQGVPLHDGALGSNRIRLGIDPYSYAPGSDVPGAFIGTDAVEPRSYLYVIARDGSLRIIDVFSPGEELECETNFDPL